MTLFTENEKVNDETVKRLFNVNARVEEIVSTKEYPLNYTPNWNGVKFHTCDMGVDDNVSKLCRIFSYLQRGLEGHATVYMHLRARNKITCDNLCNTTVSDKLGVISTINALPVVREDYITITFIFIKLDPIPV